jgi:uncharacterized integral membrane protein
MTDPYDPSLPRTNADPDLGGPPRPVSNPSGYQAGSVGPAGGAGDLAAPASEPVSPAGSPAPGTPAPGFDQRGHVRRTRASGAWIGFIATALFVILLIIFIAQNSRRVTIHFFRYHGQFSLALTILLAAVLGMLLVAIPGTLRILQLRRALRKNVPGGRLN